MIVVFFSFLLILVLYHNVGFYFVGLSQTKIIDFFGIQKRSDGIGKCASAQGTLSSLIILISVISIIILCIG